MRIQEIFESSIIMEKSLTVAELSRKNGMYLEMLTQMVEAGEALDVDPAYRDQYGDTVQMDPSMLPVMQQALADRENISKILPKTFTMIDDQGNSVPNIPWGALFKSGKFTGRAGAKAYNAGHLSELFMGVAVAAKFINRGETSNHQSVFKMLQEVAESAGVEQKNYRFTLNRKIKLPSKDQSDQVNFSGLVPAKSAESLIEQVKSGKLAADLDALFNSAIRYTNESSNMETALDRVKRQKKSTQIDVISDGTSEAKGTKADMTLKINGEKVNLVSLKTYSSITLGQISGLGYEQLSKWFGMSFGIRIDQFKDLLDPALPREEIYQNLLTKIYDGYVIGEVRKRIENQKPGKEAQIVKQLVKSAQYHARGEKLEDVEIVKLDDRVSAGGYKILKFSDDLEDAMRHLDLEVKYLDKGQSRTIQIWVKPEPGEPVAKGNKDMLCQFRTTKMGPNYRNYFETGEMLEKLTQQTIETDVEKVSDKPVKKIRARFDPEKVQVGRSRR